MGFSLSLISNHFLFIIHDYNVYIVHLQNLHSRCVYILGEAESDGSGVWTAESLRQKKEQDEGAGESPGTVWNILFTSLPGSTPAIVTASGPHLG